MPLHHTSESSVAEYWQRIYGGAAQRGIPNLPSQFAVFAAGETPAHSLIIDVGCGNGRDSFLFAQHGHAVLGLDAAPAAVESCEATRLLKGFDSTFLCIDVCDSKLIEQISSQLMRIRPSAILVYSRFFLHAVPEAGQTALFELTRALAKHASTRLAVEFRTERDAALPKKAAQHYRRFIDPMTLITEASKAGFSTDYFVEGFGYAKHGTEDAHVARCIFST